MLRGRDLFRGVAIGAAGAVVIGGAAVGTTEHDGSNAAAGTVGSTIYGSASSNQKP